ncbi:MAG: LL-diaminopimelate aminotransferase [Phycisphaerae bacterium]
MNPIRSPRLQALAPYMFVEIDRKKRQALHAGRDIIDLGIGDPDRPTPAFIRRRMAEAIEDPATHRYPPERGLPEFRQQAAAFLSHRFGVRLDPDTQIIALIGSKEGLAHLPLTVVDPAQHVLIPQPAYPVYRAATIFAGGLPYEIPLSQANAWLPDLDAIPPDIRRNARLMYLNYPNNPTAAVATNDFYRRAVDFARQHDILIVQDAAYSEIYFDQRPISILQAPGALDVAVEIHSLSKTFNMTGWRLAFAAGNADALAALAALKANIDSGQFAAIQLAGAQALAQADHVEVTAMLDIYRERRDLLVAGLRQAGFTVATPSATFYVWAQCPPGYTSIAAATRLLDQANVVMVPGVGFGPAGEGYLRAALTVELQRIRQAVDRIVSLKW